MIKEINKLYGWIHISAIKNAEKMNVFIHTHEIRNLYKGIINL